MGPGVPIFVKHGLYFIQLVSTKACLAKVGQQPEYHTVTIAKTGTSVIIFFIAKCYYKIYWLGRTFCLNFIKFGPYASTLYIGWRLMDSREAYTYVKPRLSLWLQIRLRLDHSCEHGLYLCKAFEARCNSHSLSCSHKLRHTQSSVSTLQVSVSTMVPSWSCLFQSYMWGIIQT